MSKVFRCQRQIQGDFLHIIINHRHFNYALVSEKCGICRFFGKIVVFIDTSVFS